MFESFEAIANCFNDGLPPKNYYVGLEIRDRESHKYYATWPVLEDSIPEAIKEIRSVLEPFGEDIFSHVYFCTQITDPAGNKFFKEGNPAKPLTLEEFTELYEGVTQTSIE